MKKKVILLTILLVIIIGLGVFAMANSENNGIAKVWENSKIIKYIDSVVKKDESMIKDLKINSNELAIQVANEYLDKYDLEGNTEDAKIQYLDNVRENVKTIVIDNEKCKITLNAEDGTLISYVNHKKDFPDNTLKEDQIKERAIELMDKICKIENVKYELEYIEEFDEQIWNAKFVKMYDGLKNDGERVKFSFAPESNEMYVLNIKGIKYANNEVKISEADARKIAELYLKKSVATDMKIYLAIVVPNAYYNTELKVGETYTNPSESRKAYICEFNNKGNTLVYVDATNGEILGGDSIKGEEF
ncbi:MAG: hypothetical protein IJ223_01970 [Clostridia bacterium]|nr:hypothetical protein [Clostridia bacterium]